MSARSQGERRLALAAVAELRHVDLADALSLCLLIRDDDPLRYDRAAVRWVALLLDRDRALHLGDLRELAELLQRVGDHDQVAQLRLERWLRARGFGEEADRVA